ncbi:MAG: rpsP [Frankiales bacterium]|nr:rpsP [Frankiales bacterium]
MSHRVPTARALYPARACPGPPTGCNPTQTEGRPTSERKRELSFVATKIRLMRLGKIRAPYYRIVVADSRTKREGRVIETIGKYHPKEDPSVIQIDGERAQYWLSVGAQPTEPVAALLRKTGDWQKFKGEPAPPPLLVAAPKADKKVIFEAAAKQSIADAEAEAKPKKAAAAKPKKAAEAAPEAEATPAASVSEPVATAEAADAAPAEAADAADAAPAETAAE